MFCMNCGAELPVTAAFCRKCGHPVQDTNDTPALPSVEAVEEQGSICCVEIKEKLGIFPKDQFEFRAIVCRRGNEECISASPLFNAGVGDYYQPNKKNRRHVAALDYLIDDLRDAGWQVTPATGADKVWYSRTLTKKRK